MKHLISKGLYKEALKRTKNLMIALVIIAVCVTGISFFSHASDFLAEKSHSENFRYPQYENISSVAGILPLYMYVMGVGLALSAFSFLNKRNSSDFYHAIPHSRLTLYLSNLAACATQTLIMIAIVLAIPSIGCPIVGMSFCYQFVWRALLSCFAGTMLICCATTFAMSITGTTFSNIVLAGLIIFMPRFITALAGELVCSLTSVVSISTMGVLFDPTYNIPVGVFLGFANFMSNVEGVFLSLGAAIYTAVLAVVYAVLGAFAFVKRKSETAGNSAPGKALQCVYRCAVGLVFALIFISVILAGTDDGLSLFILFCASIISFMLFELITTHSIKNVLRTLPTYGFVVLIAVLFGVSVFVSSKTVLSVEPSANEIKSIQVLSQDNGYYSGSYDSYTSVSTQRAKITSDDAIKCAVDSLSKNLNIVKSDRNLYAEGMSSSEHIKFNLKNGTSFVRYIRFDEDSSNDFLTYINADSAYIKACNSLPDKSEIVYISCSSLSETDSLRVWNTYREEVANKTIQTSENNAEESYTDSAYSTTISTDIAISVIGFRDYAYFTESYQLNADTTPKTLDLFIKLKGEQAARDKTREMLLSSIENIRTNKDALEDISGQIWILDTEYAKTHLSEYIQGSDLTVDDYLMSYNPNAFDLSPEMLDNESESNEYIAKANILYNCIKNARITDSLGERVLHFDVTINMRIAAHGEPDVYYIDSEQVDLYLELTEYDYQTYMSIFADSSFANAKDYMFD